VAKRENQRDADKLAEQGVKYTVRYDDNWLRDFFFSWILPFGILFLVWGRQQQLQFLSSAQLIEERNFSEATAQAIDTEVKALVEKGRQRTRGILTRCRAVLDALSAQLEEHEIRPNPAEGR